ncbi:clustered-type lipoprotein [Treponema sp. OMZ 799]|uniref:clustered-type lipoprotein n=1 Tax=Treponema sp. OMZ 799 TaxID=2563668 RepID=UPI0020A4DA2D|nr:clustered-type lipoprotein [Treponema sp. OMZ 799]UTC76872.1 clustered-type lipoprotein [Treponema sp. OMZ 799]
MQNNKLKLIFILILTAFLFSCSKEVKEPAEEKKSVETKVESSAKIELKQNKFLLKPEYNTHVKSPEQLKEEEKYKKSKAYEEKLDQIERELYRKEDAIIVQFPVDATDADLEQKKARTREYDDEKKVYNYVIFEEAIKEDDVYYCKQKVKTQNGGMLDYNLQIKKPRFRKYYAVLGIELMSSINIGNIDEKIIEEQVHEEIYDLKTDEKKDVMIKLFEDYENTQYPLYRKVINLSTEAVGYKQYDMRILDYVKGNFTNSGYDEYFIMFYEDDPDPEMGDQYIERARCFLVSEGKIIKDYYITFPGGAFFWGDYTHLDLKKFDNFGFQFSQGRIADFNQNGINEIYLSALFNIEPGNVLVVEFNGNEFITNYISIDTYDIGSIDWNKKMITVNAKSRAVKGFNGWQEEIDTFVWNEELKEYILFKRIYEYKRY